MGNIFRRRDPTRLTDEEYRKLLRTHYNYEPATRGNLILPDGWMQKSYEEYNQKLDDDCAFLTKLITDKKRISYSDLRSSAIIYYCKGYGYRRVSTEAEWNELKQTVVEEQRLAAENKYKELIPFFNMFLKDIEDDEERNARLSEFAKGNYENFVPPGKFIDSWMRQGPGELSTYYWYSDTYSPEEKKKRQWLHQTNTQPT